MHSAGETVLTEAGQHVGWNRVPDGINMGTMWVPSRYHAGLIWALMWDPYACARWIAVVLQLEGDGWSEVC